MIRQNDYEEQLRMAAGFCFFMTSTVTSHQLQLATHGVCSLVMLVKRPSQCRDKGEQAALIYKDISICKSLYLLMARHGMKAVDGLLVIWERQRCRSNISRVAMI